jgi:phage tail-like protein
VAAVVSDSRAGGRAAPAIPTPMRGSVEGLASPRPLGNELPAAFQEDEFCMRMVSAFDEVLAPVFSTLDCWDSYLDPQLAPDDFVDWLASWVGVDVDETWSLERRRQLIQGAVFLYRIRGTVAGLTAHLDLYAGVAPAIEESGGCGWSETAGAQLPGSPRPRLSVRLEVGDPATVNRTTVNRIVGSSRPAHLPYELEVVAEGAKARPARARKADDGATADAPGAVDLPGSERIELEPQGPESQEASEELPEPPPEPLPPPPPSSEGAEGEDHTD